MEILWEEEGFQLGFKRWQGSPGRPPRLSHSSWPLILLSSRLNQTMTPRQIWCNAIPSTTCLYPWAWIHWCLAYLHDKSQSRQKTWTKGKRCLRGLNHRSLCAGCEWVTHYLDSPRGAQARRWTSEGKKKTLEFRVRSVSIWDLKFWLICQLSCRPVHCSGLQSCNVRVHRLWSQIMNGNTCVHWSTLASNWISVRLYRINCLCPWECYEGDRQQSVCYYSSS